MEGGGEEEQGGLPGSPKRFCSGCGRVSNIRKNGCGRVMPRFYLVDVEGQERQGKRIGLARTVCIRVYRI